MLYGLLRVTESVAAKKNVATADRLAVLDHYLLAAHERLSKHLYFIFDALNCSATRFVLRIALW